MKWRVVWLPSVEEEIATYWLKPAFRDEITRATARIDEQLQRDPFALSESR